MSQVVAHAGMIMLYVPVEGRPEWVTVVFVARVVKKSKVDKQCTYT